MRHNNRKTVVTIQPFSISSRHNPVIALPAINERLIFAGLTKALTGLLHQSKTRMD
ncbi:hypothetical protein T03_13556 [Trichinella britovi]|uniref:Uncharacterized protein n=1 Tax=Trichinella britovi TaxID=45882 RepID=A0A0V1B649_TRIBR|nr:hypothetical protein T03_13556 [Trichinella britovi]